MSELYYPAMFVVVPLVLALVYWAAHDPSTVRDLAAWHLYQSQKLNAWAKAQDSRKAVYRKVMAKHNLPKTRRPQLTEVMEG